MQERQNVYSSGDPLRSPCASTHAIRVQVGGRSLAVAMCFDPCNPCSGRWAIPCGRHVQLLLPMQSAFSTVACDHSPQREMTFPPLALSKRSRIARPSPCASKLLHRMTFTSDSSSTRNPAKRRAATCSSVLPST